jgi:hypothetical protein
VSNRPAESDWRPVVLRRLAERFTGTRGAWIVLFLYAILPAQIQADTAGLRHSMEVFGAVLLLGAVSRPASEWTGLRLPGQAALAFAILVLTRVNYTATGTMLLAYAALRSRRIRPIWAVVPALILLAVHLHNNKTRHGDAFHSVNMHTYWFANLEFAGRPGFPTEEERRLEPHRPSLKFGEWALEHHTPGEFLKETFVGVFRCLWIFFERVYFASGLPAVVGKLLLALYLIGLAMSFFRPSDRPLGFSLCLFVLPYAFVSHVFWAGRFFVPFSPIALMLATRAAQEGERMIRRRMKPGFAPFLTLQDDL